MRASVVGAGAAFVVCALTLAALPAMAQKVMPTAKLAALGRQAANPAEKSAVRSSDLRPSADILFAAITAGIPRAVRDVPRPDCDAEPFGPVRDAACAQRRRALQSAAAVVLAAGWDIESVRAGCAAFANGMVGEISAARASGAAGVVRDMAARYAQGPASATPASAVARVQACLGMGYVENRADMMLGAALALVGLGDAAAPAFVGAILPAGQLAAEWYDLAALALDDSEADQDRARLLHAAAMAMRGASEPPRIAAMAGPRLTEVRAAASP